MNKIYIGNLSYELDTPDLEAAFSQFGEITDAVVIKDKASGRSRGFGFVSFQGQAQAQAALAMDGKDLAGRPMRVRVAEPKVENA